MIVSAEIWRVLSVFSRTVQWEVYEYGDQQILFISSDGWLIGWPVKSPWAGGYE